MPSGLTGHRKATCGSKVDRCGPIVGRRCGASGYGFFAENAEFAEACAKAGLTFIGPGATAMRTMGSKTNAREIAIAAGVPVVPGGNAPDDVGYPLLVKAVAGGGGKGMRVVRTAEELESAVRLARSEALSSFGDDRVYFERLLERPRHVEVQLLGDTHGAIAPFVERECSIQRRHQKLIEETPSPAVTQALRERLMAAAVAIGQRGALHERGHNRVPRGCERRVLFSRDEHAAAGGASDHRSRDGRRFCARANRDRARARDWRTWQD